MVVSIAIATPAPRPAIPVVLAPGLLCDGRLWKKAQALLGHRPCIAVDFRAQTSVEAMAQEILGVRAQRFLLAGFSMGGMAAIAAASKSAARVAGLLVLCAHGDRDTPERQALRRRQLRQARQGAFAAFVRRELVPGYFRDDSYVREESVRQAMSRAVMDMALALGPDVFRRHVGALLARPDIAKIAGGLRCPVVALSGEHDALAPPASVARLAARIAGAEFAIVPGCGHMLPLECPLAVVQALDRLEELINTQGSEK